MASRSVGQTHSPGASPYLLHGDYYGPGTEILQVSYDPKNVVSDLGADGRFVVNPESTREIGQDLLAPVKGLLAKAARSYHQRYDR